MYDHKRKQQIPHVAIRHGAQVVLDFFAISVMKIEEDSEEYVCKEGVGCVPASRYSSSSNYYELPLLMQQSGQTYLGSLIFILHRISPDVRPLANFSSLTTATSKHSCPQHSQLIFQRLFRSFDLAFVRPFYFMLLGWFCSPCL